MALALVALLALLVHAGGLGNGFTFDDTYIVADNPLVTGSGGLWPILTSHYWASVDRQGDLYRPLTVASYWLTARWFGLKPWPYHLGNILLHAIASVLVVLVCRRVSGSETAALAAGVLFAAHTVHVEAVASVVGRAELLCAVFLLSAWLARRHPIIAALLFGCALLSKENAIVLPGLLLVEDLTGRHSDPVKPVAYRQYAALLAVAGLFVVLRVALIGPRIAALDGPFVGVGILERLLTATGVLGRYIGLCLLPVGLSADYSYNQIPIAETVLDPRVIVGAAACLVLLLVGWLARRQTPAAFAGALIFFVALAPVSNLPFGIGVVMAERLLYLPSIGICLMAGALLERAVASAVSWPKQRVALVTLGVAMMPALAMGVLTVRRTAVWRDPLTLFEATVEASPDSALAHFGLGSALQADGRLQEAETAYRKSLSIAPERAETHYNLGTLLEALDRRVEAVAEYHEAVKLDDAHAKAHNNLGIIYQAEGRLDDAEAEYRSAIATGTARAIVWSNLGTLLQSQGRNDEAIEALDEATRRDPHDTRCLNNLGRLLIAVGRAHDAIPILERAVSGSGGAPTPTVNLAAAFLAVGEIDRAERLLRSVLAEHPDDAGAQRVLEALQRHRAVTR